MQYIIVYVAQVSKYSLYRFYIYYLIIDAESRPENKLNHTLKCSLLCHFSLLIKSGNPAKSDFMPTQLKQIHLLWFDLGFCYKLDSLWFVLFYRNTIYPELCTCSMF